MALISSSSGGKKKDWRLEEINEMYISLFPDDVIEAIKNILWVDQKTQGRAAIVAHLGRRGFNFTIVDSPLACLQQIDSSCANALVIEMDSKPLSGIDLLEILHQDPRYRRLPMIVVSGHDPAKLTQERALVQMFGGVKLLNKPITSISLMTALTQVFTPRAVTTAASPAANPAAGRPMPAVSRASSYARPAVPPRNSR